MIFLTKNCHGVAIGEPKPFNILLATVSGIRIAKYLILWYSIVRAQPFSAYYFIFYYVLYYLYYTILSFVRKTWSSHIGHSWPCSAFACPKLVLQSCARQNYKSLLFFQSFCLREAAFYTVGRFPHLVTSCCFPSVFAMKIASPSKNMLFSYGFYYV